MIYKIALQVIEVWRVEVQASDEEEAIEKAYGMEIDEIRAEGRLDHSEIDGAEIIGQYEEAYPDEEEDGDFYIVP